MCVCNGKRAITVSLIWYFKISFLLSEIPKTKRGRIPNFHIDVQQHMEPQLFIVMTSTISNYCSAFLFYSNLWVFVYAKGLNHTFQTNLNKMNLFPVIIIVNASSKHDAMILLGPMKLCLRNTHKNCCNSYKKIIYFRFTQTYASHILNYKRSPVIISYTFVLVGKEFFNVK